MPDLSALYPQPPQPGAAAGLLGRDPAQLVGLLGQVNALQQSQQMFAARKAAGQALQGAVTTNSDGTTTVDPDKAAAAVAADPNASLTASETLPTIADLRKSNIANSTGKVTLAATQNQYLASMINGFAADPDITPDKVRSGMVTWARQGGMDSQTLTAMMAGMPQQGGAPLQAWARKIGSFGMTPSERATRVPGPPGPNNETTTAPLDIVNAGGAGTPPVPSTTPGGAPVPGTAAGVVRTTLPPNVVADMQADQSAFNDDRARSAALTTSARPLLSALPLIEGLSQSNFGPAAKGYNAFKGLMSTAGIVNPANTELPAAQEANKYLHQIVGQVSSSDRSDKALAQNAASNPDLDLTKPANLAVIKKNYGYTMMDAAKPALYKLENPANATNSGYQTWRADANNKYDDRAFQVPLLNGDEIAALQKSIGPPTLPNGKPNPAYGKFYKTLAAGRKTGFIAPPQPAPQ